jgi:hypothetical protein
MSPPDSSHLAWQGLYMVLLALPVAAVSWTFTHEEIFHEMREFCTRKSQRCRNLLQRKFFYIFICEYCLSHYVAIIFISLSRFKLLVDSWIGYVISLFAVVAVANFYMSLFGRLRVDIRSERAEAVVKEVEVKEKQLAVEEQEQEHRKRRAS